jgi:hypothetical protein
MGSIRMLWQMDLPQNPQVYHIQVAVEGSIAHFQKQFPEVKINAIEVHPDILNSAYKGKKDINGYPLHGSSDIFRGQVGIAFDDSMEDLVNKKRKERNVQLPT